MGAIKPKFDCEKRIINLKGARNPNLVLLAGANNTVPFDLSLDTKNRVLVLSGPKCWWKICFA